MIDGPPKSDPSEEGPGKVTIVESGSASMSLYARLKAKIDLIRQNKDGKKIEIQSVRYEGAVKAQLKELCDFFDYQPLTEFILENFHRGRPAEPAGSVIKVDWVSSKTRKLRVNFMLSSIDSNKMDIWVLEVIDLAESGWGGLVTVPSQGVPAEVANEVRNLTRSGFLTGVQELVRFGIRVLTGGA